jgi:glycosyltransferase involved in cell wall biosynthesis
MKIGYDAKRLFSNRTGLGNYSRSIVRNLQHFYPHNEYHLFTPSTEQFGLTDYFFDAEKFHIHESTARLKAYWRSFSMVKDLQKAGIQLYHGLSNELPHNLPQSGIKSIVSIHDLIFKIYPETYSLSERIIYDQKFRYACRNADKIIAISENTKRDIVSLYKIAPEKIDVIYQPCQPNFYILRSDDENEQVLRQYQLPEQYFLYVGSVEARKNLKLIIEAYRLKSKEINIPLVIVGRGKQYKNECQKMISDYGLESSFFWLESFENNLHLQSIIQRAIALIYPSFYEGFGLPIAEALLCNTPVIAADTSSLREAGGENSIYINPSKPNELAAAMIQLKEDSNLADQISKSGYEYAHQKFAPAALMSQMMNLYQNLLSK